MIRQLKRQLVVNFLKVGDNRECPLCGWRGYCFLPTSRLEKRRFDAACPNCRCIERHRLAYYVAKNTLQLDGTRTLHVAPEPVIEKFLRGMSDDYLSIDLEAAAMRKMDITNLELPDNSQSLIWCSHVLEHVPDDRRAMAEMFRVCQPGGKAVLQVPIWREQTYEDFSITSREERKAKFYQPDHVRLYGLDFADRLREVGFEVAIYRAQDYGPETILRHSLEFASTNEVFVATKP